MKAFYTHTKHLYFIAISVIIAGCFFSACDFESDGMVIPLVTTSTTVTDYSPISVVCSGKVINNRGAAITSYGFCWSSSGIPTIKNGKIEATEMDSLGNFTAKVMGLESKRAYNIRAYAISKKGAGYGKLITVKTTPYSTIDTKPAINVTSTSADCGGDISFDYGLEIFEKGVCWKVGSTPTIEDFSLSFGAETGQYTVTVTGLKPSTTYMVRAYSKCVLGVEYGDLEVFTTSPPPSTK